MRDFLKHLRHNFFFNLKTLLIFELLYRLFSIVVMLPLFRLAFFGIIRLCGISYLTGESLAVIVKNPLFFVLSGVLLLGMAIFAMIEISAVIFIFDRSEEEKKAGFSETLVFSVRNSVRVFSHHNFLIALVTLFMIPFCNLGAGFTFVGTVRLPDFWLNYIFAHPLVFILVACGVFLIIYFLINWLYSFSYFTLEGKRFRLARHYSRLLSKGHTFSGIIALFAAQVILLLIYYFVSAGGTLLINLLKGVVVHSTTASVAAYTFFSIFFGVLLFILSVMSMPFAFLIITTLFYKYKKERGYEVVHAPEVFSNKDGWRFGLVRRILGYGIAAAVAVFILINVSDYTYGLVTGRDQLRMQGNEEVLVTAHRGASLHYPENTCAAVYGASQLGADCCEIDVQMTKDKRLAITHDKKLKRLTGVNKNVWELDMDELKELTVAGEDAFIEEPEHIAELSEVLSAAKETGILMNVEIKPHGHGDSDIAELVVSEINKAECEDLCVISSMKQAVLKEVKRIAPSMKTVYISSLAFGDPGELDFADGISVEATFASRELVQSAHRANMDISAWTINDIVRAQEMIASGVDNIITDDVVTIRQIVESAKDTGWALRWYLDFTGALLR